MSIFRIALANTRVPTTPEESVELAEQAIVEAAIERASLICFPECSVPGYRGFGKTMPPPDPVFLERAWGRMAKAACKASVAQVVFHPHFHIAEPGSYRPSTFGEPANSFHEKAALCRAAENTCYFATVNQASEGSPTTSAVVRPDGTLLSYHPYGKQGLLVADLNLAEATGLLAMRCKYGQ
jgi:predicted amidohydrolase